MAKKTVEQMVKPTMTLRQHEVTFSTDDKCMEFLVAQRWPDGVRCPRCKSERVHKLKAKWRWQCKQCNKHGYKFSPLKGSIFENTNVPLTVWFKVIFLMCHSKKGISAHQVWRMIGGKDANKKGDYRTAWYMCHRIRAAMESQDFVHMSGG